MAISRNGYLKVALAFCSLACGSIVAQTATVQALGDLRISVGATVDFRPAGTVFQDLQLSATGSEVVQQPFGGPVTATAIAGGRYTLSPVGAQPIVYEVNEGMSHLAGQGTFGLPLLPSVLWGVGGGGNETLLTVFSQHGFAGFRLKTTHVGQCSGSPWPGPQAIALVDIGNDGSWDPVGPQGVIVTQVFPLAAWANVLHVKVKTVPQFGSPFCAHQFRLEIEDSIYGNGPNVSHEKIGGSWSLFSPLPWPLSQSQSEALGSIAQDVTGPQLDLLGVPAARSLGLAVADDFTVGGLGSWEVNGMTLYAYVQGTPLASVPLASTVVYAQIFQGDPRYGGAPVLPGGLAGVQCTTTLVQPLDLYRLLESSPAWDVSRKVSRIDVALPSAVTLQPGTYWLMVSFDGVAAEVPPLVAWNTAVTGNAIQFGGSMWQPVTSGQGAYPQGIPFLLRGRRPDQEGSISVVSPSQVLACGTTRISVAGAPVLGGFLSFEAVNMVRPLGLHAVGLDLDGQTSGLPGCAPQCVAGHGWAVIVPGGHQLNVPALPVLHGTTVFAQVAELANDGCAALQVAFSETVAAHIR